MPPISDDSSQRGATKFDAPTRGTHKTARGSGKPDTAVGIPIYRQEHPEFAAYLHRFEKVRTVLMGPDCVKAAGRAYLPALHDQSADDFDRYKNRATFVSFCKRTLKALIGLLTRKTPEVEVKGLGDDFTGDVDLQGSTLNEYIRRTCSELGAQGRGGTLVDWSESESRPYFASYCAETITNWDTQRIGGRMVLTMLTLKEEGHALNPVTLEHEACETFRVYQLIDGVVTLQVAKVVDGQEREMTPMELKRRGKALTFIPFIFHTLDGNVPDVGDLPMEDLAELNLSHYRTSADLENGRHLAGLPTPYAFGFDPDEDLTMGTSHAWMSSNTDAKVGFLEFTGKGLSELRDALKEKQEQMAVLGAQLLQPEKADAEAFGTVKLKADAEQATLVNVAEAASATISLALQIAAWWSGTAAKPQDTADGNYVVLPTDFVAQRMDAQTFTALISGMQQSAISWETFFYNCQQGELYAEGWTKEDEERAMEQGPMGSPPVPKAPPGQPPADPAKLPADPNAPPADPEA